MSKKQKSALIVFIVFVMILLIVVGGYLFLREYFPLDYQDEIKEYSSEYDLDPYFVTAIIHTESKFRASAESEAGAIGLMQIMPETGEWIAGKLGEKDDFSSASLLEADTNIRYGCWYLNYLFEKFDGDQDKVSAAYNAGHNRVAQWLDNPEYSTDGTSLNEIPYKETEEYVKRVNRAYDVYQILYSSAF